MEEDSVFAVRDQYFDYIEPGQFSYDLDNVTLALLKRTTSFDFMVCVKALNLGPKTFKGAINPYAPPHEKRAKSLDQ